MTGEPVPVRKLAAVEVRALDRPGGDDLPSVFSGTLVTAGQGIVEVAATGPRAELGKIGKALEETEPEPTLLQSETARMVRTLASVGLVACVLVVVVFALTRGGGAEVWKRGILAGIAMAMAILPEEFPVVLTVFLALGAWRLSRNHVLTRRMPAVEMLGAATVLCVDKTERALREAGDRLIKDTELLHPLRSLVREYPLTPGLLAVSHAWRSGDDEVVVVAAKGAPEAIADLCHLTPSDGPRWRAR